MLGDWDRGVVYIVYFILGYSIYWGEGFMSSGDKYLVWFMIYDEK